MLTGQPIRIQRIRAGRAKPGLMRQHLACVQAALAVSGGHAEGAELNSQQLLFEPGAVRAGDYEFKVGSAGSCTLVLQTVLPVLMLAEGPSRVALHGGTHNPMAPPFHFLERSFAPLLRRLGIGLDLRLKRHGFYPAGGGEVRIEIRPPAQGRAGLTPYDIEERGAQREGYAEALIPALPGSVATRELEAVGHALGWSGEQLRVPEVRQHEGPGNALMVTLAHEQVCEVFTTFGEKNVSAERVASSLIKEVRAYQLSRGALGEYLADQWMLPLALAIAARGGSASYTCSVVSEHARTNVGVIETFLPVRFSVEAEEARWRITAAAQR